MEMMAAVVAGEEAGTGLRVGCDGWSHDLQSD
jgi:hypothetical protein